MVKPQEHPHKQSSMKAVFPLAPLPRRPYIGESSCSLGGGVESPNHQGSQGKLTKVRTPKVTIQLPRQVDRLTPELTAADRWEFTSGNWAFSLTPSGSRQQAQSWTHGITGAICT